MALHKKFPKDKFQILDPSIRWFPADEDLRKEGYEKLLPPFVPELREKVAEWRKNNYEGSSERQKKIAYKILYVKQEEWERYKPTSFKQLAEVLK